MGKLRFTFTNTLFYLILASVIFFCTNLNFLRGETFPFFGLSTIILLTVFTVVMMVVYFILEHKKNGFKVDFILMPIFTILAGLFIFIIWSQPTETFTTDLGSVTVDPTPYKFAYSIQILLMFALLYAMFSFLKKKQLSSKVVNILIYIFFLLLAASFIFSFLTEFHKFVYLFTGTPQTLAKYTGLTSFFYNENVYAMFLMIGILSLFVLISQKQKWYYFVFLVIFFFFLLLTTCSTLILNLGLACLIYFFVIVGFNYKKKISYGVITSIIYVLTVSLLVIGVVVLLHFDVKWFSNIFEYFFKQIADKDFNSFTNRTIIWESVWNSLIKSNPLYIIFGRGYGTGYNYFLSMISVTIPNQATYQTSIHSTHSGYIDILLRFGFFGIGLYTLFICYFIVCCIYLIVKGKSLYGFASLISLAVILGHSAFESNVLFDFNYFSMFETLLFIMPVFGQAYALRKPQIKEELIKEEHYSTPIEKSKLSTLLASIFLFLIIFTSLSFLIPELREHVLVRKYMVIGLVALGIGYLFVSGILSCFLTKTSKFKYFKTIIYFVIYFVLQGGLITGLYFLNKAGFVIDIYIVTLAFSFVYFLVSSIIILNLNHYKFKYYFKHIFINVLSISWYPALIASSIICMLFFLVPIFIEIDMFFQISSLAIGAFLYGLTYLASPSHFSLYLNHHINENTLGRLTRISNS